MREGGSGDIQVREMMARANIERLKRCLLRIGGSGPNNNGFAYYGFQESTAEVRLKVEAWS